MSFWFGCRVFGAQIEMVPHRQCAHVHRTVRPMYARATAYCKHCATWCRLWYMTQDGSYCIGVGHGVVQNTTYASGHHVWCGQVARQRPLCMALGAVHSTRCGLGMGHGLALEHDAKAHNMSRRTGCNSMTSRLDMAVRALSDIVSNGHHTCYPNNTIA